ncbi:MAG TPA: prepilin-type N-terminal cleavage/methylation domain-containing protein [Planctomycetota bacterium]|nr:prepilin-type N-terminal cleavage/methylation domain-containing protein [Planctomycetota bacterium]
MRSSARPTDRRRGFTLLEVIIAATIFSIALLIALTQIKETSDVANLGTVQADLRKQGEKCLNDIVRDLHCTLAPYAGASTNEIQFCKVGGYDTTTTLPLLFKDLRGVTTIDAPGVNKSTTPATSLWATNADPTTYVFDYSLQTVYDSNLKGNIGALVFSYSPKSSWPAAASLISSQNQIVLCRELALQGDTQPGVGTVDGFSLTWTQATASTVGLLTASTPGPFLDQPIQLSIKLVLKRRIQGKIAAGVSDQFAWTTVQTTVMLRPDENY